MGAEKYRDDNATDSRESLRAKSVNLIVYVMGLQDPVVRVEDKSPYRWTNSDIGKLYAFECITMPLDIKLSEQDGRQSEERKQTLKALVQEHFRVEFYSKLVTIEQCKLERTSALEGIIGPHRVAEKSREEAVQYLNTLDSASDVSMEELVESVICAATKDQNPKLMETIGMAVKRGAQEYIRLKTANDIGKRENWKIYREYDLILLSLLQHFSEEGFIPQVPTLIDSITEDLRSDNYKVREVRSND